MRGVTLLLILAVLLVSAFYVSYLIGYRIAPTLIKLGYVPKGLHHAKISVRDFKPYFYPGSINL